MATVSVLNTTSNVSGKTLLTAENPYTVTGLISFDRDPNPPFAVSAASAVVPNLDADKVDGYEASALAVLAENETVSGTWTFSAKPTVSAGIQFPATQAASADANTLDDYEEGSWTPVIGGSGGTSGQTYTANTAGRYIKVGRVVTCIFQAELTVEGTITGNVEIQGLPFTSINVTGLAAAGSLRFNSLATSWVNVQWVVAANTSVALVRGATAAATSNETALTAADINNSTYFSGVITYFTAN